MLSIRFIDKKSPTTILEPYAAPHVYTNPQGATYVKHTPDQEMLDAWITFKFKRIHPDTHAPVAFAELLEGGSYNAGYTAVSYGKRIDDTESDTMPTWIVDKYGSDELKGIQKPEEEAPLELPEIPAPEFETVEEALTAAQNLIDPTDSNQEVEATIEEEVAEEAPSS